MRSSHVITLAVALTSASLSVAQAQPAGTLQDIQIRGTTDLLTGLVKVNLPVQVGDPVSQINLTAVQLAVLGQGFFQKASAELQDIAGKTVLVITVVPNSDIKALVVKSTFIPPDRIKAALEGNLNISAGTTLNAVRVEQSKDLLSKAYRDAGFPFAPRVITDIVEAKDGATITYTLEETAPLSKLVLKGNTAIPVAVLEAAFAPLVSSGKFDVAAYQRAIQTVGMAYANAGYSGSGIDVKSSELAGGTLTIQLRELKIASIDTTPLGKAVVLKAKAGDLFNVKTLGDELRLIGNQLGQTVELGFAQSQDNPATVSVSFTLSPLPAGKVTRVEVKGSGVLSPAEIKAALRLRVGDQYNVSLAQDDYLSLQKAYREKGFELATQPDPISFTDGVLTFNLREIKIGAYELKWKGNQTSQDRIVLRELPAPGSLFNAEKLRKGFENVIRTSIFQLGTPQIRPSESDPTSLIVSLEVSDTAKFNFFPGLTWSSLDGFSGNLGLEYNNLFGLAHKVTLQLSGQQNDAGQYLSGSLSYTVPWLDIDFLDFKTVRTQVTGSVYSTVTGNIKLLDANNAQVKNTDATGTPVDPAREYSQRSSGVEFSVSRPLSDFLSLGISASYTQDQNYLENATDADLLPRVGLPVSPGTPLTSLPSVSSYVPQDGATTLLSSGLNFDNTNNPEFPSSGFRASGNVGFGFGNAGATNYNWTRVATGGSTYFGFGDVLSNGSNQQVVAVRANAGTLFGSAPANRQFSVGGSDVSVSPAETLHGYESREFTGTNFFSSSAEYRYNFNVNAGIAQGLYGVAFADLGDAWQSTRDPFLKWGVGAGVQLNLGLGTFLLPALRFDYAFSERNPNGKFSFRLGNFF